MLKNKSTRNKVLWGAPLFAALSLVIGVALGIALITSNQPQIVMHLWLKVLLSIAASASIILGYSGALLILRYSFKRRPPTPRLSSGLPGYADRLKFVEQIVNEQQDIERYRLYEIVSASL